MSAAVYAGSFDPVTFGHLNIIERVAPLFDSLTVLVANDPTKNYFFTPDERKQLIEKSIKKAPNVRVDFWSGLTVDYVKKAKAKYLVRGIRSISDFDHEFVMSEMNKKLDPNIDTIFVPADSEFHFISSRAVKEVALNGGDLGAFVPAAVAKAVREKIVQKRKTT
ncbi:MAG TPA: pantetheine-phosphate adenylyltransferase [Bdellovibrionales bacterium]|nr:pantetheine-phosphate adenylyltransferase [Bdellovibrionales bacterium]